MPYTIHALFSMLSCCNKQELARQVAYLKEENRILRARLPEHIRTTPQERRRLLKSGRKLKEKLQGLITIVTYKTFQKWVRNGEDSKRGKPGKKTGRRRTPEEIRELIVTVYKQTGYGYTRILGELRKLRIKVARQTVKNILKEAGYTYDPSALPDSWEARPARRLIKEDEVKAAVVRSRTAMLRHSGSATF